MSNPELQQTSHTGAQLGKIEAIPVTATSVEHDLATRTNIYADLQAGRLLMVVADTNDVFYAFSSESGGTVDNTSTTAASTTACGRFVKDEPTPVIPPMVSQQQVNSSAGALTNTGLCRYLLVKTASATATLRLWVATEPPHRRLA